MPSVLVQAGFVELALGALSGWLVAASIDRPHWLQAAGVRQARRLRQAHLDWIIMGVLLIAVGTALPDLPAWVAWPLGVGAWTNATLFLPLAWRPGWIDHPAYKTASVLSFLAVCVGTVGAAYVAIV